MGRSGYNKDYDSDDDEWDPEDWRIPLVPKSLWQSTKQGPGSVNQESSPKTKELLISLLESFAGTFQNCLDNATRDGQRPFLLWPSEGCRAEVRLALRTFFYASQTSATIPLVCQRVSEACCDIIIARAMGDSINMNHVTPNSYFEDLLDGKSSAARPGQFRTATPEDALRLYIQERGALSSSSSTPRAFSNTELKRNLLLAKLIDPVIKSEPFQNLVQNIIFCGYKHYSTLQMEAFEAQARVTFEGGGHDKPICVHTDWDPVRLLCDSTPQNGPNDHKMLCLGELLTLSGSERFPYATSCHDYVTKIWPRVARGVLPTLEGIIRKATKARLPVNQRNNPLQGDMTWCLTLPDENEDSAWYTADICLGDSGMHLTVDGNIDDMTALVQMLAWLSAALRSAPESDPALCLTNLEARSEGLFLSQSLVSFTRDQKERECWIPALPSTVIAEGFPVPYRGHAVGLEIPLSVFSGLVGAFHVANYSGGPVIKGFSSMLLPIDVGPHGIQWHLVSSADQESPLSYEEGVRLCPNRATSEKIPSGSIWMSRCFVGWCRHVESFLGRGPGDVEYDAIHGSHARPIKSRVVLESISAGFQQFGAFQLNAKIIPFQSHVYFQNQWRRFESILALAQKTMVLLYDSGDRRAWLCNGCEVILHMIQSRLVLAPINSEKVGPMIDASRGVAKDVLLSHAQLAFEENYTIKDMIHNTWSMLEFLDCELRARHSSFGKPVLKHALWGYEFKSCANETSNFTIGEVYLNAGAKGWLALVEGMNVLTLLGTGFGDLLRVEKSHESEICSRWQHVPTGSDFMATTVQNLLQIYEKPWSSDQKTIMTSLKLQWNRGDAQLFEDCTKPHKNCCCQRVQGIVKSGKFKKAIPPGLLESTGGVIFGGSEILLYSQILSRNLKNKVTYF